MQAITVKKLKHGRDNMRTIRKGSRGEGVKLLQEKLKNIGYSIYPDGIFGSKTKSVVMQFQRDNNLYPDGIAGPLTWRAVYRAKPLPYSIIDYDRQTVIVKMKKSAIKKIDVMDSAGSRETVKNMYKRLTIKPTFLINGGLFDTRTGASGSLFIDEGRKITDGYYSRVAMIINGEKDIDFKEVESMPRDAIGASPTLVIDGKIQIDGRGLDYGFLNYKHPRLAVGQDKEHFYIVVVHGRRSWLLHRGLTIYQLAALCKKIGMTEAINLDGGGSIMVLDKNGKKINKPLENRAVDNAIAFYLQT